MGMSVKKTDLGAALDAMENDATFDQEARDAIAHLGEHDLLKIDQAILSSLSRDWKKAGFITAGVMIAAPDEYEDLPEAFYASRIRLLAEASRIETKGDALALKTFEIRLPPESDAA